MTWLARVDAEEVLLVMPDGQHVMGARTTSAHNPELFAVAFGGGPLTPLPATDVQPSKGVSLSHDGTKSVWSACRGVWSLGRIDARGAYVPAGSSSWQESSVAPVGATGSVAVVSERSGTTALWVVDPSGRVDARMVPGSDARGLSEELDVTPDGSLAVVEIAGRGLAVVGSPTARCAP